MSPGQSYVRTRVGDRWEAIVVGSGIGGLTPAGVLARDGMRVLILERHTTAGACTQVFRRAGYEWDAGLHYMGEEKWTRVLGQWVRWGVASIMAVRL